MLINHWSSHTAHVVVGWRGRVLKGLGLGCSLQVFVKCGGGLVEHISLSVSFIIGGGGK